jgi:hypothetical protein
VCRDCTLPEIFLHGSSILICDFVILRDAIALSLCELNIQHSAPPAIDMMEIFERVHA